MTQTQPDHRTRPRRRGGALEQAVFRATLAEIDEMGYVELSMERVAERARASKASLYRRWPSRVELVIDAVHNVMPKPEDPEDTGGLRGDILLVLRQASQMLAGTAGEALRGLLGEVLQDAERDERLREYTRGNSAIMIRTILQRAVERGEIAAESITERRVEVGPALLRQRFLFNLLPITDEFLTQITDEVMLPLFLPDGRRGT